MTEGARKQVLRAVDGERERQERKFRLTWTCADPDIYDERKLPVLAEEFGEVARAMIERDTENLYVELIQVAAVAVAWAEALVANARPGHSLRGIA